jgi:hypothetical protein
MRFPVISLASLAALGLSGCVVVTPTAPAPTAPPELGVFGSGYPSAGDPCRRSGETPFTSAFLDDAADLVSCPPGVDAAFFAASTGGSQVALLGGWSVFSIPRR